MSEIKNDILEALKKNRPNLSESSLKTYCSLLCSLYRTLEGENGLEFFNDVDKILDHIKTFDKAQTRKTILSCLFVLTGDETYRDEMHENIKKVNDFYKEQKNSPERLEKLKSLDEILNIHKQFREKYKKNPTIDNTVDLIISYLVSGVLGEELPPRRILDYSLMKINLKNVDREKDNYISNGVFHFNQYKTSDRHGSQSIKIPKELNTLINKWKKINESDYLLLNDKGEPFTSTSLSKKVSRMFEGNSMDMLRSIFLSNYYKDLPHLDRMNALAYKMGHTTQTALNYYVKKD
jgi:hypothetical protein